jgi:O-antigen/teichoic acid export membrane protein
MPDYSESNLKRNGRLLAVYRVVSMLLSLAYVPVVLGYLGTGLYGIWSTVLNIVSWVNYFDIGIGNGLRNKLSAALARKESDSSIKSLRGCSG